jgi:thioredoxin family protein
MIRALALLLALAWPPSAAPDYAAIYAKGMTFAQFLDAAEELKSEWQENFAGAKVDEASLARAKGLKGQWRLLVVAEDWCHDSVATVPYLAKLAEAAPETIAIRIVRKVEGQPVMDAHRTPDDRAATPTIVVLAADGAVGGAISERPAALWEYSKAHWKREERRQWYADDQGRHAVAEVLDIIESATKQDR